MKEFFKKPYNYFLLLISIPALVWAKETYESIVDGLRDGWGAGYGEESVYGIIVLLLWLAMWFTNLNRDKNHMFKIAGVILTVLMALILLAPFFLRGH